MTPKPMTFEQWWVAVFRESPESKPHESITQIAYRRVARLAWYAAFTAAREQGRREMNDRWQLATGMTIETAESLAGKPSAGEGTT